MKKIYLISLLAGLFALAGFLYVFDPADCNLFPPCPFYTITGLYCPGCGSQRALHDILHLDAAGAAANNLLVIPAILVIIYHILYQLIRPKHQNILYYNSTPRIILGIIIIFWILRNLPFYPFTLLAPS
jgi:hypothetical protein